jgi:hypothetical protein
LHLRSFILFSLILPVCLQAQQESQNSPIPARQSVLLHLAPTDTVYNLHQEFILPGSDRVLLDSMVNLRRSVDYEVQYWNGILQFKNETLKRVFADSLPHTALVTFTALPLPFKPEYLLHTVTLSKDTAGGGARRVITSASAFSVEDLFGSGFQKSGSIFRGFTVGSNRDLSLNSGFRMQFSGKLSSDIDIVAALTDENSPIQPEGTTQTLQELDKVFVEISSPKYGVTLGDFNLEVNQQQGGEFGRLSRKVEGADGSLRLRDFAGRGTTAAFSLFGATARGKFATNQLQGIDGNQGPYRLIGRDGTSRIVVIAGTERVYLNGDLITRGETNDYTIDYSVGEITFTPRRLITNASRITVDYQYTDRQFTRNLVGATLESTAWNDRVKIHAVIAQEADDPSSPIDFTLDDSTKALLRQSGADRFKASVTGSQFAGRDSITGAGKGQYVLRDTSINGKKFLIFVYAPADPQAVYSVTFSFVDQVPPDSVGYARVVSGQYQVAGLGQGNYLPIRFLPIPELHRVLNGRIEAAPLPDLVFSAEYAASMYDRNRLSAFDDSNDNGGAYKVSLRYNPKSIRVAGSNLGKLDLNVSDRFVDRRFVPLDRDNDIEFNRKWDLTNTSAADEEIREASLSYAPLKSLSVGAGYGSLERTGTFQSDRTTVSAALSDSSLPRSAYFLERIEATDLQIDDRSTWVRQRGTAAYTFWNLQPAVRVEAEKRVEYGSSSDSLADGSFRFVEIAPRVGIGEIGPVTASAEFQFRTEDSSATGNLARASRSFTQLYDWQLREWNSLSSLLSLSIRSTEFTDQFKARGDANSDVILVRSQSRFNPWKRALDSDLFYEFARERSAQLERVFLQVQKGSGNYRYLGDLNGNGIADANEFEQTRFDGDYVAFYLPGDQLVPVSDLKTGFRVRFQPSRLLQQPSSTLERIAKSISTETLVRIEERSTEPDTRQIYLLNFSRFLNEQTTIAGTNLLTQDVYLFENDPSLSIRFRYNQRRGFVRLAQAPEKSFLKERSVRIRSQLVKEIGNETEFINKLDQVNSSASSPRLRDLLTDELRTRFSYRPEPAWEVSYGIGVSRVLNRYGGQDARADMNDQFVGLTYAFVGLGQLRGQFTREEVRISGIAGGINQQYPFEFTNGKVPGKTYLWEFALDYRIGRYVQLTVNYNGRSEGGAAPVHNARAEARAFF